MLEGLRKEKGTRESVSCPFPSASLPASNWHKVSWINRLFFCCICTHVYTYILYVAWKRRLPRKCARFVPFRPIQKRSFNLLCVLDFFSFSERWQSTQFQIKKKKKSTRWTDSLPDTVVVQLNGIKHTGTVAMGVDRFWVHRRTVSHMSLKRIS